MKTFQDLATRQEIASRLATLSEDDRRRWGKMSSHQMLCHLADSYRTALGEKAITPATGLLQQTIIKLIFLHIPVRWPKCLPTRPEVEQGKGGTRPARFDQDRGTLISIVRRFCDHPSTSYAPHPIFGPMTQKDWLRWGYLHADHHLRQFGR